MKSESSSLRRLCCFCLIPSLNNLYDNEESAKIAMLGITASIPYEFSLYGSQEDYDEDSSITTKIDSHPA